MSADDPTAEAPNGQPAAEHMRAEHYEIRVRGRLGTRWAAWFDGMTLTQDDDGTTVISGPIVDQAALHGQLQRLRDLSVSLISLTRLGPDTATEPTHPIPDPTRSDPPGATS